LSDLGLFRSRVDFHRSCRSSPTPPSTARVLYSMSFANCKAILHPAVICGFQPGDPLTFFLPADLRPRTPSSDAHLSYLRLRKHLNLMIRIGLDAAKASWRSLVSITISLWVMQVTDLILVGNFRNLAPPWLGGVLADSPTDDLNPISLRRYRFWPRHPIARTGIGNALSRWRKCFLELSP